jgi:hypothetical protein
MPLRIIIIIITITIDTLGKCSPPPPEIHYSLLRYTIICTMSLSRVKCLLLQYTIFFFLLQLLFLNQLKFRLCYFLDLVLFLCRFCVSLHLFVASLYLCRICNLVSARRVSILIITIIIVIIDNAII